MCGRYAASRDKATLVAEFEVTKAPERDLAADYNVAPTKEVYAVVDRAPGPSSGEPPTVRRELAIVKWGLVPSWAKDPTIGSRMINARVETLTEKPAYRRAVAKRRCLLPADGYYEWYEPSEPDAPRGRNGRPLKQPFFIHPADGSVLAMAGLYEFWRNPELPDGDPAAWLWTVTVITTSAPDALGRIHDRMPMCVTPDRWASWLDPEITDGADAVALLRPAAPGWLTAEPVGRDVNNVRNNGPELIEPIAAV
ncbi:MAG: SOS response-associated peptidase [Candidatus Nanopelagicales bacterium]